MRPLRLMKYLSARDVVKLLPISRPTFYKWANAGKFGDLVKKDIESNVYYVDPEDIPKLKKILER